MTFTRRELVAFLAASTAMTEAVGRALAQMPEEGEAPVVDPVPLPAPVAKPTLNNRALILSAGDIGVQPGATEVLVPVSLNEPARQTMVVRYLTQNDTAKEGQQFARAEGYLAFQPGEQHKTIPVKLKGTFPADKRFRVQVAWPQNDPTIKIAKGSALVSGDVTIIPPAVDATPRPLPARPSGLALAFQEDFLDFEATDSGIGNSGRPCWRSRPIHGRTQPGNNELGFYADPALHEAAPWGRDANGRFQLQAEHFPNGLRNHDGSLVPFNYSASMITSDKLVSINRGSYFEAKLTIPQVVGSWPALWIAPNDGSWPSIELDLFELFANGSAGLDKLGTTVHWRNEAGAHQMFSSRLPYLGIDLKLPHVWGCHWDDHLVTFYCDDQPYFAVPNVFPDKDCHLMLNVAVGGNVVGKPPRPETDFPVRMPIDWVKVWR